MTRIVIHRRAPGGPRWFELDGRRFEVLGSNQGGMAGWGYEVYEPASGASWDGYFHLNEIRDGFAGELDTPGG